MKMDFGHIISAVITAGAIVVATAIGSSAYRSVMSQSQKNEAVDGCLKSSVYRNVQTNKETGAVTTTEEALNSSVEKCLDLKGY